jgi:anti-sigma B factor antagonist
MQSVEGAPIREHEALRFRREERQGQRTLVVIGEVDLATGGVFRDELRGLIDDTRSPALIDLSEVSFFDSTGLNALIFAKKRADLTGVRLVLVAPSAFVRRVLDMTGLSTILETRD